ncbi:MAG TPA: lysophospholipid acyltransferase family protein [candidate division Zixibacteria bacterium]|nr:lysophospholipid acyltransferase family protein [candidate division Zixibacteria bacterium]
MGINFQRIINSRLGVGFTLAFARTLPPSIGYPLANVLAGQLASRKSLKLIQAARINQWVVHGEKSTASELDDAVASNLRHTAHCLYDTYHYLLNEEAIQRLIIIGPGVRERLKEIKRDKKGIIIVGPHLSNFDFVGQAASGTELDALALAFPDPGGGYQWQNQIRRSSGMEIVPTSLDTMRKAKQVLRDGGIVLTALDRPVVGTKYQPKFFGRPASLPLHHILLALKTDVPILVVAVVMNQDGRYEVVYSDPVIMVREADRDSELVHNAERVLAIAEDFIRLAPSQWSMYYPVWPEVQDFLP